MNTARITIGVTAAIPEVAMVAAIRPYGRASVMTRFIDGSGYAISIPYATPLTALARVAEQFGHHMESTGFGAGITFQPN